MVSTFKLKNIFDDDFCTSMSKKYGFLNIDNNEIRENLENTFKDFIILILSENNAYTLEERNKLYQEAIYNLEHTSCVAIIKKIKKNTTFLENTISGPVTNLN